MKSGSARCLDFVIALWLPCPMTRHSEIFVCDNRRKRLMCVIRDSARTASISLPAADPNNRRGSTPFSRTHLEEA